MTQSNSIARTHIEGDSALPVLVFLHEGLGCSALWKGFPETLCQKTGCRGVLYDRRGYGDSPPELRRRTIHYLHRAALDELPQLLGETIGNQEYILIGHSDGGSIALIHAGEKPPGLRGIVTLAAHVFVEECTLDGIRHAVQLWDTGKLAGLAKYHGEKTDRVFSSWANTWLSPWFSSWNIEYLLPSIEVPILAIQGEDDQYGSQLQLQRIVEQAPAHAESAIIPGCGHSPHLEAEDRVLQLVTNFLHTVCRANR